MCCQPDYLHRQGTATTHHMPRLNIQFGCSRNGKWINPKMLPKTLIFKANYATGKFVGDFFYRRETPLLVFRYMSAQQLIITIQKNTGNRLIKQRFWQASIKLNHYHK